MEIKKKKKKGVSRYFTAEKKGKIYKDRKGRIERKEKITIEYLFISVKVEMDGIIFFLNRNIYVGDSFSFSVSLRMSGHRNNQKTQNSLLTLVSLSFRLAFYRVFIIYCVFPTAEF